MAGGAYHGDAEPTEAWRVLAAEPGAALVDVRTAAEWTFVGLPDLQAIGAPLVREEWQTYPSMQINPGFVENVDRALRAAGSGPARPVFFLCRSGARSAAAAAAMTAAGYERAYNVAGGFEGNRDEHGHRGSKDGWKAAGLPWVQS
jgi:rhodanese-related sulfurtransferase